MIDDQQQDAIPAGYYKGRVVADSAQYGVTTNGNDQIVLDIDVPKLGRQFSTFLVFSDNGAQYEIERLRACGWAGDDILHLTGVDKNEVDVQIAYEVYNGKRQMKVRIATGGGRFKLEATMDDKQKRAFAARMKSFLKGDPAMPDWMKD